MAQTKKGGQQGFASMDENKRKEVAKKGGESHGQKSDNNSTNKSSDRKNK